MTLRLFVCISIAFFFSMTALAQPAIHMSDDYPVEYIGEYISVLQDESREMTIEDVISNPESFKQNNTPVPNLGVTNYNNWIKFSVINNSNQNSLVLSISDPIVDRVTLYRTTYGSLDSSTIDLKDASSERVWDHQFFTFELFLTKGDSATFYLKLNSEKQLLVPIKISDARSIVSEMSGFDVRSGGYLGIILSMMLYNLFLYVSARDKHYLVYVNYFFWVSLAQFAILGYFSRFFPTTLFSTGSLVTFAGAMSGIASVIFVKSFLNIGENNPKLNVWLNAIIVADLFAICLLFFGMPLWSYQMVNFVAGIGSVIVLRVGFIAYKSGNRPAKLFLIAWGIFLGSVIIFVLKDYGILPYNRFTFHAVQIGSAIEALLLSFALGDKINILKKEKEESQARELASLLENERLVREQNVVLEQKVEERTEELTASNVSLQETLLHLKETQSQLVEAEKMASLGQLTAGVAHEINNPINFVSSNVAPLKRDIKMIWDTLAQVERIAFDPDLSVEAKQAQIVAYKEEIDIAYLREEVDFLLKGMQDGAHRTAEIVKSLRIFSRVDEDSFKFVDINEGLESTMVILNTLITEGITVEKKYGELPKVECEAGKMNQAFLNILTNAIYAINQKFGNTRGGKLEIETGLHKDSANIYMRIADNGTGIPETIREKIFEPFFTTKDVGEGTGLGMSITYNTIAKHQGKIEVESEEGVGTVFTLILPIHQNITGK